VDFVLSESEMKTSPTLYFVLLIGPASPRTDRAIDDLDTEIFFCDNKDASLSQSESKLSEPK